jgi:outer membrane protein TolC
MSINGSEVFVRPWVSLFVVAGATTGCLSSHTSESRSAAVAELNRAADQGSQVLQPARDAEHRLSPRAAEGAAPPRSAEASSAVPAARTASSCEDLASAVAVTHPRVIAARERASSALAMSRAEGALPPPDATFEVWDFPIGDPSLADEEGMYMLGVGQKFPAAGMRDGRARAQAELARAEVGRMAEAQRGVWAEVALACADWAAARLVQGRLADHRALVASMREALLARYRAGGDTLAVVARADAELAAADRHIVEAEAEVVLARETLAALAGEQIRLPDEAPPIVDRAGELDTQSLVKLAASWRGAVRVVRAQREAASALRQSASAEARSPDFEVRATYMQTPSQRAGLGAMVGMSLPWLWGGGDEREASATAELNAVLADEADVKRMIRVEVTRAAERVRALRRSLDALREREIPAAKAVLEAERASFLSGSFELVGWISSAHALREAHVDEARARGEVERAYVTLEAAVGAALPRAIGDEP